MFRKLAIALAATFVVAGTAMAPTSADAKGKFIFKPHHHHHHHHGHHFHRGFGLVAPVVVASGCYAKRWVPTPWGPRLRWVNVCY